MSDLGLLLDDLLMDYIRVAGIFFVGGIALFNFTNFGKHFAIISFLIALVLCIAAVVDYYFERDRISKLGFSPRKVIDVLAFVTIGIVLLIVWVIYQVWQTEPSSLSTLIKEIEEEVDVTNERLISTIRELDEKIIETNKELISTIKGEPYTKTLSKPIQDYSTTTKKYTNILKSLGKQEQDTRMISALAAVS